MSCAETLLALAQVIFQARETTTLHVEDLHSLR